MRALWIPAGIAVWALHFAALYGFTALACARGFPGAVPWAAAGATVAALALLAAIAAANLGRRAQFTGWLALAVAAAALLGIVWQALPAFMVSACG